MLLMVSGYLKNSEVAVDALSICITIYGWESMIPLGFFAATGVRVANELGAGNVKSAKFAAEVALVNSTVVAIFFCAIILAFPRKLAMIFTSNSSIMEMVDELAFFLGTTILLNCIQPILSGVAVGSGWQALAAYINIGSYYIVGVPLGITFGWFFHFGIKGVWSGMVLGTVVQTLILGVVAVRCQRRKEVQNSRIQVDDSGTSKSTLH